VVGSLNASGSRWCLCFGTLLSLIRDKKFNVSQDIDIGIIGNDTGILQHLGAVFPSSGLVADNVTGEPLNIHYGIGDGICLDLFFWRKNGACAYHCYDEQGQRPKNGRLSQYHFKGIPAWIFWPTKKDLASVPKGAWIERTINGYDPDDPIGEIAKGDYTYNVPCPGMEQEGVSLHVPFGFGAALDYWYPGCWAKKDETYGVSKSFNEFTVSTCRGLWR
jgi:hypothetical protein